VAGGLIAKACALIGAAQMHSPEVGKVDPQVAPILQPAPDEAIDRQRPGTVGPQLESRVDQDNPGGVRPPPPQAFAEEHLPIPDRWRLASNLGIRDNPLDPYNQNRLKGDRPVKGTEDCFIALTGISDTVVEPRSFPIPVAQQGTTRPGSNDVFGRSNSLVFSQTFIAGGSLIKGLTAFKPPEIELRALLAYNVNYVTVPETRVLSVQPTRGSTRLDHFLALQEIFLDYHLRNVSDKYDFDSLRVGIQPFSTDFRGFLFQDNQLGIRLFGNRDNNRIQYNLAAFFRIEKDTNSGLNDVISGVRDDQIFLANVYRQDLPFPGLTSQLTVVYNRNREKGQIFIDSNGFPQRPALQGNLRARDYDIVYLGYNADGRFGRVNLTASGYVALGEDRNNVLTNKPAYVQAFFGAAEASYDIDWVRVRLSGLYASGDGNPRDNKEEGFDAIFENPLFAGADTSYWIRQTIPFAGGGRAISLNGRNGILNSLRSSKEQGQSNFLNPGTVLLGAGADFDILPELRVSLNINHLWVAETAVLKAFRMQDNINNDLGGDYSVAAIWRPKFTQNIVVRASFAAFDPGRGFGQLFVARGRDDVYYSGLLNLTVNY
jgi:hypothetical protein